MTFTSLDERTSFRPTSSDDDDLTHIYCDCDPDLALCGADVSDDPVVEDGEDVCVVCVDLDPQPCGRCGA